MVPELLVSPDREETAPLRLKVSRPTELRSLMAEPEVVRFREPRPNSFEPKARSTLRPAAAENTFWPSRNTFPPRSTLGVIPGCRSERRIWSIRSMRSRPRATSETWGDCSWFRLIMVRARFSTGK